MSAGIRVDAVCCLCGVRRPVAHLEDGHVVCNVCSHTPVEHPFATFRGRLRWFWGRWRELPLPFWWVAKEWLLNELRRWK